MKATKTIIIHSKVASGYVGSNTSALILQINGYDIITIPTVVYSNHLSLPTFGGGKISDDMFASILKGVLELNIFQQVSTIITGFIGSKEQVVATAHFIKACKKQNPEILYLCDPVMGDIDKGQYVPTEIPDAMIEHLIPLADILTPNHFEAERIINAKIHKLENATQLLEQKFNLSKQKIVITSFNFDQADTDFVYKFIIENAIPNLIKTPKIDLHPAGTGELFTAHLYLSLLEHKNFIDAAQTSANRVSNTLLNMLHEGRKEFELKDIILFMKISKKQH